MIVSYAKVTAGLTAIFVAAAPLASAQAAEAAASQDRAQVYIDGVVAAGLTCDLTSMTLRNSNAQRDVVEFGCANGDGRIATFTKAATPVVTLYNCATGWIVQYDCTVAKAPVAYPSLTADIKKFDFSSRCVVDGSRAMGFATNRRSAFLEVSCTDPSLNGQVLQYDAATLKPMALTDCAAATSMGGGCKLPDAVKGGVPVPNNSMASQYGASTLTDSGNGGFDRTSLMSGGLVPR